MRKMLLGIAVAVAVATAVPVAADQLIQPLLSSNEPHDTRPLDPPDHFTAPERGKPAPAPQPVTPVIPDPLPDLRPPGGYPLPPGVLPNPLPDWKP